MLLSFYYRPMGKHRMRIWFLMALLACLICFLLGCSPKPSTKAETPQGFGQSRAADLEVKPKQSNIVVEWDKTVTAQVDVNWLGDQKYPVQIAPANGAPSWLKVETRPAILEPPGTMDIDLKAEVTPGILGEHRITFEASAYQLSAPVTFELTIDVQRQGGEFFPLQPQRATNECRNVCGKIVDGGLAFYDILREKDQECTDSKLPETQRIGLKTFGVSDKGFGYAHGCNVAGIYEAAGTFSIVNLGFFELPIKRGEVFVTLRDVASCWFSADNTLALVQIGRGYAPYDLLSGQPVGDVCYPTRDIGRVVMYNNVLNIEKCEWKIR
jgi:hypothetical protein